MHAGGGVMPLHDLDQRGRSLVIYDEFFTPDFGYIYCHVCIFEGYDSSGYTANSGLM